jgi:hypothetical protein
MTAIFQKSLRLRGVSSDVGYVLNLMGTDCSRLLEGVAEIHYLWSGVLEGSKKAKFHQITNNLTWDIFNFSASNYRPSCIPGGLSCSYRGW